MTIDKPGTPQTGDDLNPIWGIIAALAAMGACLLVVYVLRRREHD